MKSKFTIKSYLLSIFSFVVFLAMINTYSFFFDSYYNDKLFLKIFIPSILTFSFISFFFGEMRTKNISVEFVNSRIIVKRFYGVKKEFFQKKDVKGYKYSVLSNYGGSTAEFIYLYDSRNKKIIKLSDFYHKNYYEIKDYINKNFEDLGYENFSYIDEFKVIFT